MKILVAVLVVLVLVGGVGYWMMRGKAGTSVNQVNQVDQEDGEITSDEMESTRAPEEGTFSGTFEQLVARGGSYQCSFAIDDKGTGTVYVGNGKMAGEMRMTTDGVTVPMAMVGDAKVMNFWMDVQGMGKMGFKMDLEQAAKMAPTGGVSMSQVEQIQKQYNYDCKPWIVDEAKFVLPSDVNFKAL